MHYMHEFARYQHTMAPARAYFQSFQPVLLNPLPLLWCQVRRILLCDRMDGITACYGSTLVFLLVSFHSEAVNV